MARSIKYESTVEQVKCMICNKGGFTADNPPVKYKGYTDHLLCFAKDFIKKFCKKESQTDALHLESVSDVMKLPKLNAAWAALVLHTKKEQMECDIAYADSKKKLEEFLQEMIAKDNGLGILGIFRKGDRIPFETRRIIHIVETE